MGPPSEVDTSEINPQQNKARDRPQPYSALVDVDLGALSHPGKVRSNNEDHFLILRFGRFLETVQTNLPPGSVPPRAEEGGYGMVVADGMGGRAAGEEASRQAISSLVNLVLHTPDWILRTDEEIMVSEVLLRAAERYEQINQTLAEQARADPQLSGFGTTMTMVFSLGRELVLAHVGDSRAYLLRQGQLRQLTRDHTMVQAMLDQGYLDPKKAATHHLRHVLTQALGAQGQPVQANVDRLTLENNDCLLLCTDGLTELVPDQVIGAILGSGEPAQTVCQRLVDRALEAGGSDNVTVVVARYWLP